MFRTVLALLLCLLLPLQAGATLARSAAMAMHGGVHATAATVSELQATGEHADHQVHGGKLQRHDQVHHEHKQYKQNKQHHEHHARMPTADAKVSGHKTLHAKAGCVDCAKCCLIAASAPPPALPASFAPAVARASFISQRAPAPAFLTDGPERPPRHRTA